MRRSVSHLMIPVLLLSPASVQGQTTPDAPIGTPSRPLMAVPDSAPAPAAQAATIGPVAGAQMVALRTRTLPAPAPRSPRGDTSENRALMIVGGVGLLVGAVIGGDAGTLVMLGSAGAGLWGLYKFLK